MLARFGRWEYAALSLLVLVVFMLHLAVIMRPATPVFDEQYYVPDARLVLQGEGSTRIEHPPLGKLLIAGGMLVFGDNPCGWRLPSVLAGLACIILFYLICRELRLSPRASFYATFLLALENLSFVQGSLAMLDVFSLVFMLAAFWLYLRGKYLSAGAAVGLATLAKLTGALALPVIALHWLLAGRPRPGRFLLSLLAAPAAFLLLMPLLDLAVWHRWVSPFQELAAMGRAIPLATFAAYPSPMLSRPWDWLLRPELITYWVDPHYVGMISPTLWALIVPTVLYTAYRSLKGSRAALLALAWGGGTYLFWVALSLTTDRISYVYYFYPTVGAVCLGLGLGAEQALASTSQTRWAKIARLAVPVYLLLSLAAFAVLAPVAYGWKLPACVVLYVLARTQLGRTPRRTELPAAAPSPAPG